ncbi:PP2C family serine/threonine-protein phosphatase [Elizabethkingia ursingii]|uniref:PPM-type phosphatase domain-containing protein n=1 Tax=Elizabethkingia ursingii TaxID=1756150 RepID=A0ABX3NAC3_9FLAO|nr:PP2C family serine/threonine-protein phosphatase [Elizabethkingia ursingii]OPB87562.1 hypothetical protein BB021_09860 [Elizabethkingia ursingii]
MEKFLQQLLKDNHFEQSKIVDNTILKLVDNVKVSDLTKAITSIKQQIIEIFKMYKSKEEFKDKYIALTNANAKKEYEYIFDLSEFPDIVIKEIRNLEGIGLQFETETNKIFGIPIFANTIDLQIVFYNKTDENQSEDIKTLPFIINPDPKDLWKNLPSDKNLKYAKEDNTALLSDFLDKKIVVASKRGRSHAHEGLFRDDHFCMKALPDNWAIIAVADGAGSAKYSRQGSKIATEFIVESFNNEEILLHLSELSKEYFNHKSTAKESQNVDNVTQQKENLILKTKSVILNILYKHIKNLHTELTKFAQDENIQLKELHTTLIFTIIKKFDFGYIILSFGVGDCPINVISKDFEEIKLLNIMDIGETSGGTRFITMPEIFNNTDMSARFDIHIFEDFSKLFLMTDGIYDPKFVTENKLEDSASWKSFMNDLNGENEDHIKVDFNDEENIQEQLLKWMDFWSKGNHDDRTLAIIYQI